MHIQLAACNIHIYSMIYSRKMPAYKFWPADYNSTRIQVASFTMTATIMCIGYIFILHSLINR